MNDKNSLIEYYRRQVIERINTETYKAVVFDPVTGEPIKVGDKIKKESRLIVPKWTECMKTHIKVVSGSSNKNMAEQIFDLGEVLRDIFYSTKDESVETDRSQSGLSDAGKYWEELVTYYLNMCLVNTRTVVFLQASPFSAVKTAVTFNGMDSHSEVDVIAITFPDNSVFTDDYHDVLDGLRTRFSKADVKGTELEFIYSKRIKKETSLVDRLADYLVSENYPDIELHVLQCKTNWNDSIQTPMLWSLVYYLSRDGVSLPSGSNIRFGSGKYTLERLHGFSYSFVAVPTQNNGAYDKNPEVAANHKKDFDDKFSENKLPVKRARLIRGGYYWGLPRFNSINPVSELLNTNLNHGHAGHIVDIIEQNLTKGVFKSDYDYFLLLK